MNDDDAVDAVRYLVERLLPLVDDVGWAVQGVFPTVDDPGIPWAYTVGLSRKGWPELAITGMSPTQCQLVLNLVVQHCIETGTRPVAGAGPDVLDGGYRLHLRPCDVRDIDYPLGAARLFAQFEEQPLSALQVVWPDDERRYPWDAGYDADRFPQPLLRDVVKPT